MWCVFVPSNFDNARISDLVDEIDNDIVFLYAKRIEMFSDGFREIFFTLASVFLSSCHCRRAQADAWSGEYPVVVRIGERGRGVEEVFETVIVQHISVEGCPLQLYNVHCQLTAEIIS